jgi:hypothetical protein
MEPEKVYSLWGLCKTLPKVYAPIANPWINIENASVEDLKR